MMSREIDISQTAGLHIPLHYCELLHKFCPGLKLIHREALVDDTPNYVYAQDQ